MHNFQNATARWLLFLLLLGVAMTTTWARPVPKDSVSRAPFGANTPGIPLHEAPPQSRVYMAKTHDARRTQAHTVHKPSQEHHEMIKALDEDIRLHVHGHHLARQTVRPNPNLSSKDKCHYVPYGRWNFAELPVLSFRYDPRGSGLSDATVERVLYEAYQTWRDASVPGTIPPLELRRHTFLSHSNHANSEPLHPSSLKIVHTQREKALLSKHKKEKTTLATPVREERKGIRNGVNEISFVPKTSQTSEDAVTIAEVLLWKRQSTNEIVEVDIVFRSPISPDDPRPFSWTTSGSSGPAEPNTADLFSVATTEFGHALGLGISKCRDHTAHAITAPGDTKKATLECGDRKGIRELYSRPTTF